MRNIWNVVLSEWVRCNSNKSVSFIDDYRSSESGTDHSIGDRLSYLSTEMSKLSGLGLEGTVNYRKLRDEYYKLKGESEKSTEVPTTKAKKNDEDSITRYIRKSKSLLLLEWSSVMNLVMNNDLYVYKAPSYTRELSDSVINDIRILNEETKEGVSDVSVGINNMSIITSVIVEDNYSGILGKEKDELEDYGYSNAVNSIISMGLVPFGNLSCSIPKDFSSQRMPAINDGIIKVNTSPLSGGDVLILGLRGDFDHEKIMVSSSRQFGYSSKCYSSEYVKLTKKLENGIEDVNKKMSERTEELDEINPESDPVVCKACSSGLIIGGQWCEFVNEEARRIYSKSER